MRKLLKRLLYSRFPLVRGSFPYFGCRVYFPPRSKAFLAACEQGVFEAGNIAVLQHMCREQTVMFDVGANIGLMAIPILKMKRECTVISFEPSPNTLPFLLRTVSESGYEERWRVVPKAVNDRAGRAHFSLASAEDALYDGFRATHRVSERSQIIVEATTIDEEWLRLGTPSVSIIKIDIEGAEMIALRGAERCIAAQRPPILLEWNRDNLAAYHCPVGALVEFSSANGFRIYALPDAIPVLDETELALQMLRTESFLLIPDLSHSANAG